MYNRLKEGRKDVDGHARPGRSSASTTDENIGTVKTTILDNRQVTIREIADNVGISFVLWQIS